MTVSPMANMDDSGVFGAVMCLEYIGLWIFATGNRGMYFLENSASDTLFCAVALNKFYCVYLKTGGTILTLVSEMLLTNYFLAVQSMLIHLKDRTKFNFVKTRK